MDNAPDPSNIAKKVAHLDAHHRFSLASVGAVLVFLATHWHASLATQLVGAWDAFALTTVALAWIVVANHDPYEVRRMAPLRDAGRTFLFATVVTAAIASLVAVFLLGPAKDLPRASFVAHLSVSFIAVVLSWILVHTLFCIR